MSQATTTLPSAGFISTVDLIRQIVKRPDLRAALTAAGHLARELLDEELARVRSKEAVDQARRINGEKGGRPRSQDALAMWAIDREARSRLLRSDGELPERAAYKLAAEALCAAYNSHYHSVARTKEAQDRLADNTRNRRRRPGKAALRAKTERFAELLAVVTIAAGGCQEQGTCADGSAS